MIIKQAELNPVTGNYVTIFESTVMTLHRARAKSKQGCRRCHGRGIEKMDHPGKGLKWVQTCECVHRKDK